MIGVDDRFGLSAPPWQLMQKFALTAEHIAQQAIKMHSSAENKKKLNIKDLSITEKLGKRISIDSPINSKCTRSKL
jgi:hypothetical protein